MIFPKSSSDLYQELKTNLEAMGITNFSESSVANILLTTITNNYRDQTNAIQSALDATNFLTASGRDLDTVAALFGITRSPARRASSTALERNFRFYVSSGTFGDLNAGNDIIVPVNTVLYYESRDRTRRIEYRLVSPVTLSAAASNQFIAVEAIRPGKSSNVSKLIVSNHTLSYGSLLVANVYPVINGADEQTDEAIRYFISIYITERNGYGLDSFRRLLAGVEGINEYKVIPFYEGAGTFALILDFFDNAVSQHYIDSITNRLKTRVSAGEKLIVKRVSQIRVAPSLEIVVATNYSLGEATSDINSVLLDAFNELAIGNSLDLSSLIDDIADLASVDSVVGDSFAEVIVTYIDSALNEQSASISNLALVPSADAKLFLSDVTVVGT